MKKLAAVLTVFLIGTFSAGAFAADMKIGYVHIQKIMRDAPQKAAVEARMKSAFSGRDAEIKKMEADIKELQEKFQRDLPTLSQSQATEQKRQIEQKLADYQLKTRAFQEDVNQKSAEEQRAILKEIDAAIKQVADAGGFTLVLQNNAMVYQNGQISDLTDQVLATMGKK